MSKLGFTPISAYIWMEAQDAEDVVVGGIFLQEKKIANEGKIVAIGSLCDIEISKRLKIGDVILYDPTIVKKINVRGNSYFILVDKNVTAVFDRDYDE